MCPIKLEAISGKYLSQVEVDHFQSNQHEINGISAFKFILGQQRKSLSPTLYYIDQNLNVTCSTCEMTWYDAREFHPQRSEYRLYYSNNDVFYNAQVGDLMLLCESTDSNYIIIIIEKNSTLFKTIPNKLTLEYIRNDFVINAPTDKEFINITWKLCESNSNISFFESNSGH